MGRCGCASDQCSCTVVAGENVTVSGVGSRNNPYVVSAATTVVDESGDPLPTTERITGEITMFGGTAAPTGWLICNGAAVNRAVYADLYAILGTSFGAGDGSTTFNLPDFTDRFPMGVSGSAPRGTKAGDNDVSIAAANLPAHTHSINHDHASFTTASGGAHDHNLDGADAGSSTTRVAKGSGANTATITSPTLTDGAHTHAIDVPAFTGTSGSTGSGTPLDIKPAFSAVNFIIKV